MIGTSNPLAVEAALGVLDEGGTAVDAALASDAVLGVVQPMSSGVGGDLFCLVDDGGEVTAFNGSGAAPAAMSMAGWSDRSPFTVTVPGAVDGWAQLSERYGRVGLDRVLEPAVRLARDGFPLGAVASRTWRAESTRWSGSPPLPAQPRAGERVTNPELARTLAAIAAEGRDAHYEGPFAHAAVEAVEHMTLDDLAAHRGEWVDPIATTYRDHEIVELPPNGQGAAVLAALNELDEKPLGPAGDPETVDRTMNAVRRGMEMAYSQIGDPRCSPVDPFWQARDTVYTAVVADGMCVSLISSVFMAFGSGIWAGGAFLQNRGFGFSLDPNHPNAAAAGKRPFHTIIPGLVRRDGRAEVVFGVVGGPMQPQGQVQVLTHLYDHGMDVQEALDAPRAFWLGGDSLALEPGIDADALAARGWDPLRIGEHWFGVGQVVRLYDDGWLEGGSDPRHDGVAVGRLHT